MRTARRTAAALLCAGLLQAAAAGATELTVRVEGVRSAEGTVRLALYDMPGEFPRGERRDGADLPAAEGSVEHVFAGLEPGRYAVAMYHDENDNGTFDTGLFGFPLEGFGFSNGATAGITGPPDFDEAAVTVDDTGGVTVVRVSYW